NPFEYSFLAGFLTSNSGEIPIPKKDGTIRMLKIPTIADRAWQCLAKYALEPAHEATFHARSFGFRTSKPKSFSQRAIFTEC
ncbi:RNA-dependent DNA polymerase, partial [Dolichospermum flos-aquae UHCC 0037]|nr:RNA-dependent DNA polymerase [Dolichospermum flos-aquae UHCC 0037]